ncbi:MAG: divergent polysaccharide deacetylase family protein [Gammaproteobacteria bacterium]|nr:divergent polysaccharide deacetylase family protein [Gammaproteobacteria bacterium]MCW8841450.1 divergent polysaccharide deacetylase family protein [Gammaproteobacteria bacterium]MCW8927719.1 divergent polysaccharide deacetylase family protein [Gammaproteobacteria bacterium]MCW8958643.1 divergent polysaccharide deacetylase family protein [Gammaproteobacteria bacterium]MCW8971987.1 divergent polysaccharide deacetylase family protein [Gammaproteobacteria bacterium]
MSTGHPWRRLLVGVCCALAVTAAAADGQPASPPVIALIIDDLGDRLDAGSRAIELPGQLTYAILPRTPYSRRLAELAHGAGKEVMLHQPMQAINGRAMGPGGMDMVMSQRALLDTLEANLASVPHARGVNNHMGSLLTRHPGHMGWLMAALRERGNLYFIDSTTTNKTVAQQIAVEHELPTMRRQVFLDHHREERQILKQFVRLLRLAHSNGYALGIGHPYPETLAVLQKVLPHLEGFGVRLVPASELITHKEKRREQLWHASLSPLPKGVKSLKR